MPKTGIHSHRTAGGQRAAEEARAYMDAFGPFAKAYEEQWDTIVRALTEACRKRQQDPDCRENQGGEPCAADVDSH